MEVLLVYLALVNAISLTLMHVDKKKAVRGKWRIPERTLLGVCFLGGSLGGFLGMQLFRHKTQHPKFYITVPLLLVLQAFALVWLLPKL